MEPTRCARGYSALPFSVCAVGGGSALNGARLMRGPLGPLLAQHVGELQAMSTEANNDHLTGSAQVIRPASIPSEESFGTPSIWQTYSFAPEWFMDAFHEAKKPSDHHARRREIIFAVCFAESYLVEWVRDEVLNRDFNRLNHYFPPGKWSNVTEKWKEVPKKLLEDGLIPGVPDLSLSYWQDWLDLVKMRNGLIHARSSRPETDPQPEDARPLPSKGDLDHLPAGWAVHVVVALIRNLNRAVGSSSPTWLIEP
jgi:hypothetical protein